MKMRLWLTASLLLSALATAAPAADEPSPITWKKIVVDKVFLSEGVAVADLNNDGKADIATGEVWYEAPDWKKHRIRKGPDDFTKGDQNVYSESFAVWAEDFNADGWLDLIVIPFPGKPCHWYENPQGKDEMWKQHEIWHSACNETIAYLDLLGNGKRVLLMGWQPQGKETEGQMAYFTPAKDPYAKWEMHAVSEPSQPGKEVPGTRKFSHGLGAGDVNGDGRLDVICTGGWWEQPEKLDGKPWKFHPVNLGPDCADMFAYDVDGDKKADIISSSAHGQGIWWHQQRGDKGEFQRQDLFPKLVSQTHAMHCVDVNGDGMKDLVTGKRWWAHGKTGDVDPAAPAKLYWLEAKKGSDGVVAFTPREIDDDSGIGTQFAVADVNGDKLLDVVVANKKGVFILEQVRKK